MSSSGLSICALVFLVGVLVGGRLRAQEAAPATPPANAVRVVAFVGTFEFSRAGAQQWDPCYTNQVLFPGDRGRTRENSGVTLLFSDNSVQRVGERSEFQVPVPAPRDSGPSFNLFRGVLYLFHREKPSNYRINSQTASATTRGTEFNVEVDGQSGRMVLTMIEGEAKLENDLGSVILGRGDQGVAEPGQPPIRSKGVYVASIIQWCLHYPAILDLDELELDSVVSEVLGDSIAAYRDGDMLKALARYPALRVPASVQERVYYASLVLAVGNVDEAERWLGSIEAEQGEGDHSSVSTRLARSIRRMIATVKGEVAAAGAAVFPASGAALATEWLGESYARQASLDLKGALDAAQKAREMAPNWGLAAVRVAELEFGFGQTTRASAALREGLEAVPHHGEARALRGFVLAADDRIDEAKAEFEVAIAIDGGLANAWLGRGLCKIRTGALAEGRRDLEVAAALEPLRAELRSYLGKAYHQAGDFPRAENELKLGTQLDLNDPTGWLYLALLRSDQNQANDAVRALERSQALNDNRQVYRSRFLLDQDRAVRGANLALLYQDAGLRDVALREAVQAVNFDYGNYSAHLFLANAFNELRDPKLVNLRFETAWLTEYLMANLLAPVGAGTLSQSVSHHEYSRLFERNYLGFASTTDYFSDGHWLMDSVLHGRYEGTGFAAESYYQSANGDRPNNDLEQLGFTLRVKQQVTPRDGLYLQAGTYESESGDVNSYFQQSAANLGLRVKESQEPSVLGGWHHAWSPHWQSLVFGGHVEDDLRVTNPNQDTLLFNRGFGGPVLSASPVLFNQEYRSEFDLDTVETQHIWQKEKHALIFGGRYQAGHFDSENLERGGRFPNGVALATVVAQTLRSDFERANAYLYEHWRLIPSLLLIGGLSYDYLKSPQNFRYAPLAAGEESTSRLLPKAGVLWRPLRETMVRASYVRSLGGVSLDQSFRLEPSQVAGFNQAYRSLIPESVAGANSGAIFETAGVSIERHVPGTGTYVALSSEWLRSDVARNLGTIDLVIPVPPAPPGPALFPGTTREELWFRERSITATIHQLLGEEWSLGASYRWSQAELDRVYPGVEESVVPLFGFQRRQQLEAVLQRLSLSALFNHPSGFFGSVEALWMHQSNRGYATDLPGDDFWQFNVFGGYRFPRKRAEIRVGVLNVGDQDYLLNPLNLAMDLPRARTLALSVRLNF